MRVVVCAKSEATLVFFYVFDALMPVVAFAENIEH
jgi:uncharacterized membrane protein YcfT